MSLLLQVGVSLSYSVW